MKILKFIMYLFALIACVVGLFVFMSDNSSNKKAQEQKDLDKSIVVIEKGTNFKKYLDLETGCKWLEGPKGMSPYVKDGKFDCNQVYVTQYKKQQKNK